MTRRLNHAQLVAAEEISSPPTLAPSRACESQHFDLPGGIYIAMAALFASAIAVLAMAFRENMLVSYAIVFAFLAAFFGVPAVFLKASRKEGLRPLEWHQFRETGVDTATGVSRAGEAMVLVLVLPFLILCWAVAIATIAAIVR